MISLSGPGRKKARERRAPGAPPDAVARAARRGRGVREIRAVTIPAGRARKELRVAPVHTAKAAATKLRSAASDSSQNHDHLAAIDALDGPSPGSSLWRPAAPGPQCSQLNLIMSEVLMDVHKLPGTAKMVLFLGAGCHLWLILLVGSVSRPPSGTRS